jgi:hypothetical protein
MVEQIPAHLQVVAPWDVILNRSPNGVNRCLRTFGGPAVRRARSGRLAHRDQFALDLGHLPPFRVAQDQPVPQAQDLAIHMQHQPVPLVGDPGVPTQSEQPLADQPKRFVSPATPRASRPVPWWRRASPIVAWSDAPECGCGSRPCR